MQVYTGDGKGKTTAAFGLALRAYGNGLKVAILQFMKEGGPLQSGEAAAARQLPGVELYKFGRSFIFKPEPSREEVAQAVRAGISTARKIMDEGTCDLLVLDEIFLPLFYELIDLDDVLGLIEAKPPSIELVMTGRRAPTDILDRADLVTEMTPVKHPYTRGITARKGIEY